jgi:hypothetical protein
MKAYKFIFLFLFFLFAQAISLKAQTNLVINGSFEEVGEDDLPVGWTCYGTNVNYGIVTDVEDIPDGTKALSVDLNTTGLRYVQQTMHGVIEGETYTLSFSHRVYKEPTNTSSENFNYNYVWIGADGSPIGSPFTSDALVFVKDMWIPLETEITAPTGATGFNIKINFRRNIGVYLDDVRVVKTSGVTDKQDQYIQNLPDSITKNAGDADFPLEGTTTSGLPVSYSSSNEAVATIDGSTVHIVGAGDVIITASQAGNEEYEPAQDVRVKLAVYPTKQDQTIPGLVDMTKNVSDPDFELPATASSGLPVTYSMPPGSNGVAIITGGNIVHIASNATPGSSATITASQAGNHLWNPVEVTVTLTLSNTTVVKQDQTITSLSDISKAIGDPDFELTAEATSSLQVTYTSSNTQVATIYAGKMVHIEGAGTTTITASQVGNSEWNPAPDVTATLTVSYNAGIDEVKASLPVRIEGDKLIVSAAAGSQIDVYTVVGSRLQSAVSSGSETVLSGLPKGEVLIVRSGYAVAKIIN